MLMLLSAQIILITSKQEEGIAASTGVLWKSAEVALMVEQLFPSSYCRSPILNAEAHFLMQIISKGLHQPDTHTTNGMESVTIQEKKGWWDRLWTCQPFNCPFRDTDTTFYQLITSFPTQQVMYSILTYIFA